jgi:predicted DNA binding CopG/RHH family protein
MRKEYNFSHATSNPYTKKLKKQITIRLDINTIKYFKEQSKKVTVPYQQLINFYLSDCARHEKKLYLNWK